LKGEHECTIYVFMATAFTQRVDCSLVFVLK